MKTIRSVLILTAICFTIEAPVTLFAGNHISLSVSSAVRLVNPQDSTDCSFLLKFDIPEELSSNVIIDYVSLRIRGNFGLLSSGAPTVAVSPVTVSWSAGNVTWSEGWSIGGANVKDSVVYTAPLSVKKGYEGKIMITRIVKDWIEEEYANRGLLLQVLDREASLNQLSTVSEDEIAKIDIYYSKK